MSKTPARSPRVHPLHSLFVTCTLMAAFCVLAVVGTIELRNAQQLVNKTQDRLSTRAQEVTGLLGMQMGGSVSFNNLFALEKIVSGVVEQAGREAIGAVVVNKAGEVIYVTDDAVLTGGEVVALVQQAAAENTIMSGAGGLTAAVPIYFGAENAVVGAVATVWTDQYIKAALAAKQRTTLMIAFGVFSAALGAIAFFLWIRMSHPLVKLERAMGAVAAEDYDVSIPYTDRKDEVGQMACRLDAFRSTLALAKEAAVDTAFKSAAFVGSSAPLIMVDSDFKIIFANPAGEALVHSLSAELSVQWPGLDPDRLTGADMKDFAALEPTIKKVRARTETPSEGHTSTAVNIRLGERTIRVKMNPAFDETGEMFGCIFEWSDRTESQRNAAVIGAINAGQINVEFGIDGAVHDGNDYFLRMIDGTFEDTGHCSLSRMFAGNLDNDPDGHRFAEQVFAGEITRGRFSAYSVHADRSFILEGTFAVIRDEQGAPERAILLANDVTEQDTAMRTVEAQRKKDASEQSDVVELLGSALNALADGDLNADIQQEVPPAYEKLRTDFNAAVASLRNAIHAVISNADSIRNETTEITSAADDLSRRTEKQAATLEETAAALDELTVSVRSAAEGADDASKMSAEAQKNAEQGGDVARQAVTAMDAIKNSSQEISKINSVIDDIAFQTNLLALNAGVEAARAGEAGRGFAVVATEVRALALRSSEAASEINTLISSSGDQVSRGVDLVDRTGDALASIVTSIAEISNRVSNIASSAREQSSGLAEINTAVNELDHVTQQNAAMFEETTAASHALTAEANALANAVSQFKLDSATVSKPQAAPVAQTGAAPATADPAPAAAPPAISGNTALAASTAVDPEGWEDF